MIWCAMVCDSIEWLFALRHVLFDDCTCLWSSRAAHTISEVDVLSLYKRKALIL